MCQISCHSVCEVPNFADFIDTVADKLANKKTVNNKNVGQLPNVMAALPNIGGALCSTPQFG